MKKKTGILLLALSLAVSLTACGSAPAADAAGGKAASGEAAGGDDVIVLRSCFANGMTGAVNNFAIEKGLYEQEGIRFENVQTTGAANDIVLSLLARGEIDVADGDPSTYIPGIDNGVPAKLVGNMWRYSGCYWLIANNEIQSIADLKGKTVGTAATTGGMRLSVLKMLESAGLTEDDVTLVANGTYQDAYATFTSGSVDATIIHNPYAALAEKEGVGHTLGRAWDYIPDYYTGTIIASDDLIQNDPEKLQKFITAYYKVHEAVKTEYFDEFVTWAAEQMNTDEETMRKAIESEIDVWLDYPVIPEDRVRTTLDILSGYGWLEDEIDDLDDIINNTFAEKAAQELGMTDPYAGQ